MTVLVANPRAAGGRVGRRWPRLAPILEAGLGPHEVRFTEAPGHAPELVRELLRAGHRRIVSLGGDGSHGQAAAGFFEGSRPIAPEATLSLLPLGTGGDLARMLDLPRGDLAAAARAAASDEVVPVDVGHLRFTTEDGRAEAETIFLNVASLGLGGVVDRLVARRPRRLLGGAATYLAASLEGLFRFPAPAVTLTVDGGEPLPPARLLLAAVCNGGWFGGGMRVAPEAVLHDGAFDLVVMPWRGRTAQLLRGLAIYRGAHLRQPGVTVQRCREVRAEAEGDSFLDVDGDSPGRLPATFRLLPGALRLRGTLPRRAGGRLDPEGGACQTRRASQFETP